MAGAEENDWIDSFSGAGDGARWRGRSGVLLAAGMLGEATLYSSESWGLCQRVTTREMRIPNDN